MKKIITSMIISFLVVFCTILASGLFTSVEGAADVWDFEDLWPG